MQNLTPEKIKEIYEKLPEDLKEAIFSVDTANIIRETSTTNGLTIDKMGELADEVGLVIMGITSPSQFAPNLVSRLGVDKETVDKISAVINEKIFSQIRESMKKVQEARATPENGEVEIKAPPAMQAQPEKIITVSQPKPVVKAPEKISIPVTTEMAARPEELMQPKEQEKKMEPTQPKEPQVGNIFEEKMKEGVFNVPSTEATAEKPKYPSVDPYREPIE